MAVVEHSIRGALSTIAIHGEYIAQTKSEAVRWKDRIEANTDKLGQLATDAGARPDPFTGADGRGLERRIDVLERLPDRMKYFETRLEQISTLQQQRNGPAGMK